LSSNAFALLPVQADSEEATFGTAFAHPQTDDIKEKLEKVRGIVDKLKSQRPEFRSAVELGLAVHELQYEINNPRALPASGTGVPSLQSIRNLLREAQDVSGGNNIVNDFVGLTLLRLAGQASVPAATRADLENEAIALSEKVAIQPGILSGFGDLGSTGRLSEKGQLQLLKLVLTHGKAEEDVYGEEALRRVKPKSPKLVSEILAAIGKTETKEKGKVPTLIRALETETGNSDVLNLLIQFASHRVTDQEARDDKRGEIGRNRAAALAALLAGTSYGIFHHESILRNERVRNAIRDAAGMPEGGRYDHDDGVEEAKNILEHYRDYTLDGSNPVFQRPQSSQGDLAIHNSSLPGVMPLPGPARHN
jgi:hypothetical protein